MPTLNPNPRPNEATITGIYIDIDNGRAEITANFTDGRERVALFGYYTDELDFAPIELVGMTESQAHALRHQKDVRFLQS
jgi:hypothetical protein